MKVLAEDLLRESWLDRLSPAQFVMLVAVGTLAAIILASSAANPENRRAVREQVDFLMSPIATSWNRISEAFPRAKPRRVTQARSSGCHPSYSPCLPMISDVDCVGGVGNGPAFTGRVTVIGPDVFGLDGDGDGIGCE